MMSSRLASKLAMLLVYLTELNMARLNKARVQGLAFVYFSQYFDLQKQGAASDVISHRRQVAYDLFTTQKRLFMHYAVQCQQLEHECKTLSAEVHLAMSYRAFMRWFERYSPISLEAL